MATPTPLNEHATTLCHTVGHPELVAYAPDLPITGIVDRMIAHLEKRVLEGATFGPGESIKYGWSGFKLSPLEDGRLVLSEPDMKRPMGYERTVGNVLMQAWRMKEIVASVGLLDRLTFPDLSQRVAVCANVLTTNEFLISRLPPKGTSSGWFVGCLDEKHDHESPGSIASVPIYEIACQLPALLQFLALPQGVSVAVIGPGRIRTKVFVDAEPREPKEGSYLAMMNR